MNKKAEKKAPPTFKKSVLGRQKPRKNGRKKRAVFWRRMLLGISGLTLILLAYATIFKGRQLIERAATSLNAPRTWRISLKLDDDQPLDEKTAAAVIAIAQKNLGAATADELRKAAHLVQKQAAFASIHFLKTSPSDMVISLRQRHPVLCIQADRWRFVATDRTSPNYATAVVYGEADPIQDCTGPLLSGIFEPNKKPQFHDDLTLVLDPQEKIALQDALQLNSNAKAANIDLKTIEFRSFRGFLVVLQGSETEVSLGSAPFTGKLQKLSELLSKLAKKGDLAARIELDYQGKAFIKLQKM